MSYNTSVFDSSNRNSDDEITPFVLDGMRYMSISQYMYIQKALLCDNRRIYTLLMNASDPNTIQDLGNSIENTLDWSVYARTFYRKAKLVKMIQHPELYPCYFV